MPRYIDADSALAFPLANGKYDRKNANKHFIYGCETYKEYLEQLPTITPDEVRGVGEWEDAKQHGLCRCSVCKDCYIEKGYITQAKWKYCPNCGARLEVSGGA